MIDQQIRYFTFPVLLLKGAFENITKVADDIMNYAAYAHTLKLNEGTSVDKIKAAGKYFELNWGDNIRALREGRSLFDSVPEKTPMTSVNTTIIFDYYKNRKTEVDIACLLAFAGVRSILQKKSYCKTNKAFIHARMFGYASISDMPPEEKWSELEIRYAVRWHIDKVLKELQHHWGLKLLSDHSRGFYVSFSMSLDKLAEISLEAKKKTKDKNLQEEKRKAIEKARRRVNNK